MDILKRRKEEDEEKEEVKRAEEDLQKDVDLEVMKCPDCGDHIPLRSDKCPSCGRLIFESEREKKEREFDEMLKISIKSPSEEIEKKRIEEGDQEPSEVTTRIVEAEADNNLDKTEVEAKSKTGKEDGAAKDKEPDAGTRAKLGKKGEEERAEGGRGMEEPYPEEKEPEEVREEETILSAPEPSRGYGPGLGKFVAFVIIIIGVLTYAMTPLLVADQFYAALTMIFGALIIVIGGNIAYESFTPSRPAEVEAEPEVAKMEEDEEGDVRAEEKKAGKAKEGKVEEGEEGVYACPVCRAQLKEDDNECPKCGAEFDD